MVTLLRNQVVTLVRNTLVTLNRNQVVSLSGISSWDPEIRAYFQRKMEVDKKPKMAVINAVRNKLIKRVFACVHQDRVFIKSQLRMELTSNQNATSDEP